MAKTKFAKFVAGFVGFAMAFSFVVTPVTASAATAEELQTQINSLLATIQALQSQLSSTTGGSSTTTGYTFNTNLTMGSKGTDVMNLQKVLNMSADTRVSSTGAGSPGMETSTFGGLTRAAVIKFQLKYGITPAAGYVGAITRAKLNSMNTTTVPPVVTPGNPQGGALTVSAASQPSNSLAPTSAARIPFTSLTLTAGSSDVTVNSITVERTGLGVDAVFAGVVLLDSNGTQIGISKTLNSNHQAMVGEPWVIKAGTSQTVTVAGNMAAALTNYAGQVIGLNVVAVNTSASVSGSFPIMGAMHTVNASLTLGTAQMTESSFDPDTASSKEIGTTGYKFAGVRVTAGSAEQVRLWSVRFNQTGSASSGDLSNVMVYVDGTAYPTTVSADGKYYSALFSGGILIDKGLAKDVYIQADIAGANASGRTIQFDVYKTTDIYLSGVTYGYGITPTAVNTASATTASEFTTGTPFFSGSLVTVTGGSATTIQKATSVAAANVAVNVPNQVLGGFSTDIKGEALSVQSTVFTVSTTTGDTFGLTNVTLVDANGAVVAGPVDQSGTSLTFTDTVTYPVGQKTYTLKGKLKSTTPNGTSFSISSTPSSQWTSVTGQTTGNTVSLSSNGAFTMNTMTVKAAALAISVSSSPASQNIVAGGQGITFANFQFDASQSGEDVRFSSLTVTNGGTLTASGNLTSCQLWDGSTAVNTGSNVVNPTTSTPTFTFDQQLVVSKGTVKTLTLKCNVATGVSGTAIFGLTGGQISGLTVTGVTSSNDVDPSGSTATGQTMTIATGSFAISVDPSTSNYTTVAAGTTGVTIGTFKFRATNEAVNLTKVGLTLSTSTSADLTQVYLYQGATLLGTASFTGSNTIATSTLNSPLALAKDTDVLITIKADLANIGSSETGTQGRLVKVDVTNAEATGVSSGSTLQVGGVTAGVNGVRMFKSFPVLAQDTLTSSGVADGKLMRFKITADSRGPVGLYNLNLTIATSSFSTGGGVSAVKVMVYSDSSYSLPVSGTYGAATGQFGSTGTPDAGAPTINYSATTNPLQIPAGTTYYFQVEATVTSVTTGTSVTTTLNGDAAYIAAANLNAGTFGPTVPMTSSTTGALADANNDFIWSGNATTTAVIGSNDWANGYGITGLPSGGFSTTRSQ